MTEEEKNEQQSEEAPAEDSPVEEAPAEPAAEEAPAEDAPAEEAPSEPAAEEPPVEAPDEEAAPLAPRQRRKQERSLHSGEARAQRSPAERAQERAERRRAKAEARRRWRLRSREERRAAPGAEPPAPVEKATGKARVRQGVVVSDRADKTITVRIDVQRAHRMYGKVVRTSSTLHAHDENNEAHTGDTVRVVESRPLSRTKRWRLVEILERAR
jgi:small subunit ribosomal protein S17